MMMIFFFVFIFVTLLFSKKKMGMTGILLPVHGLFNQFPGETSFFAMSIS